jgi:hypothetical protein
MLLLFWVFPLWPFSSSVAKAREYNGHDIFSTNQPPAAPAHMSDTMKLHLQAWLRTAV